MGVVVVFKTGSRRTYPSVISFGLDGEYLYIRYLNNQGEERFNRWYLPTVEKYQLSGKM